MSFIEKIQNQPRKKRLVILWISVGVVMIIILLIWFFSFSGNLGRLKEKKQSTETGDGIISLFESIKKDFSAIKGMFNAGVKEVKDIQVQINEGQKQEQGQ
jgi:biopolymer transport protein ExbB/TolQ